MCARPDGHLRLGHQVRSRHLQGTSASSSVSSLSHRSEQAIALGAKAVMVGRLWIFGMSHGFVPPHHLPCSLSERRRCRYTGCMHVMKSLLAEFDILMTVAGFPTLKDITRDAIRFNSYGIAPGSRL